MSKLKDIKLGDYIDILTDYHSGGSYKTLKEKTKILYEKNYAIMIRTLNFENDDFKDNLIYVDKNSYDFLGYSHVNENDILINKIANPGSIYIMPKIEEKVTCGMNLFLLRFKNINQRYIYYVLKNAEKAIKGLAHGTTTKTITKDDLRNVKLKIHESITEQEKVEKILTSIDYKLSNNKKIIAELESMAKTIYDYWFLQYEFPNEEGKPYKSSGGKMVYNEELKKEIPMGWQCKTINNFVDMIQGYAFSNKDYSSKGQFKLYTIKNVQDGEIISKVDNNIKIIPEKMSEECMLKPLDIIMSLTGNVGRVGLVYESNALLNQRVLKIKPKDNNTLYTYLFFRDTNIKSILENISTGTSQKNLSPVDMGNLKCLIPDNKVLNRFQENNNIIKTIINYKIENQELQNLRDFILPLLMNGQISFKN